MAKQTRRQKHKDSGHFVEAAELAEASAIHQEKARQARESVSEHTDDLLADIDEALEGMDAQEFIKAYIQRGGE